MLMYVCDCGCCVHSVHCVTVHVFMCAYLCVWTHVIMHV